MSELAFAKFERLLRWDDFSVCLRERCMLRVNGIEAYIGRRGSSPARLGVLVAKKICRRAVGRNYIKRLNREAFRQCKQHLVGFDVVIVAKSSLIGLSKREQGDRVRILWHDLVRKVSDSC